MSMRRLRVHLEVDLEVDHAILSDNNEPLSDEEVADLISASVDQESILSCIEQAIEVVATRTVKVQRRPHRPRIKAVRRGNYTQTGFGARLQRPRCKENKFTSQWSALAGGGFKE